MFKISEISVKLRPYATECEHDIEVTIKTGDKSYDKAKIVLNDDQVQRVLNAVRTEVANAFLGIGFDRPEPIEDFVPTPAFLETPPTPAPARADDDDSDPVPF